MTPMREGIPVLIVAVVCHGGLFAASPAAEPGQLSEAIGWLEKEARRLIHASRRSMNDGVSAFPPQVGIHYEAFWLRDYEYTLEGAIEAYTDDELIAACRLFAGAISDEGAGVDCVRFDGTPIYKPGYGTLGENPVADGSQFTVGVAWHTYQRTQDDGLLREILPSLEKTMRAVPRNPDNGLVHISAATPHDRCPYGFTDTIRKQGDVLFCSLLYIQACRQLEALLSAGQRADAGRVWATEAERVEASVRRVFWDGEIGLFRAATVRCREHDIWGSAFAVFLGVADRAQSLAIARYFREHYDQIVQHGQIRHLPGGVYWEDGRERDQYQNGAYWATPTGWFVYALDLVDPGLADRTVLELVKHFQEHGACEWIFGEKRQLPDYLASASLPLDGIKAMLRRRATSNGARSLR